MASFLKVPLMSHSPLRRVSSALSGVMLVLGLAACAAAPAEPPTLYARLGGAPQVDALVGRLIDRTATDPRTRRSFDGIKLKALKESLAQQI